MLPCGTLNKSYEKDIAIVRTRMQWGLLIALLVLIFTLPLFVGDVLLGFIIITSITLIAVLGLNILTGYCGQISLGQSAFMGVGAFTAAYLTAKMGISFWIALPFAVLMTVAIGVIFSLPALRVKGFYLAMTTLGAQFILYYFMGHGGSFTGGPYGIETPEPTLGSIVIASKQSWYYLVMGFTVVMTFFAKNIARTKLGRNFIAVRDNDKAAQAMGIDLFNTKMSAFIICSIYAGVAGTLWAHYIGIAHFQQYPLINSIWYLGMLVVGGMGSVTGTIFGTFFLRGLDEIIIILTPLIGNIFPALGAELFAIGGSILFALTIILFLMFEPRGLYHRWELFKASYRLMPFSY